MQIEEVVVCGVEGAQYLVAAILVHGATASASNRNQATTAVLNRRAAATNYYRIDADCQCARSGSLYRLVCCTANL